MKFMIDLESRTAKEGSLEDFEIVIEVQVAMDDASQDPLTLEEIVMQEEIYDNYEDNHVFNVVFYVLKSEQLSCSSYEVSWWIVDWGCYESKVGSQNILMFF